MMTTRVSPRFERAVPSVPPPPWEPLAHHCVFESVDARALEYRRQRARAVHDLRVAARQGLGPGSDETDIREQQVQLISDAEDADDRTLSRSPPPTSPDSPTTAASRALQQQRVNGATPTPVRTSSVTAHADPFSPDMHDVTAAAATTTGMLGGATQGASPPPAPSKRTTVSNGDGASPGGGYTVEIPRPNAIQDHFAAGGRLSVEDACDIIRGAMAILKAEPNVLRLAGPVTICGDVHGQFYDLLHVFKNLGGDPDNTQYLFLGDYVDRGSYSTEIVLTLFARKIVRPSSLWLLRGNHECSYLTSYFNFKQECLHKYDEATYDLFLKAFECLPLAAVINGEFLCVHGGLSPFLRTVEDIDNIQRFRDPPQRGPMCDLLWSDPMEEDEEELFPDALFLHNELRGCSYTYTHAAACDFLQRNNLAAIIRAHEAQEDGYRMYRKVASSGMPATICVFTAPNYCEFNNLAAILLVDGRQLQLKQFHSSPQPYTLPNFMNAFSWSIPFVFEKLDHVLIDLMEATDEVLASNFEPGTLAARIANSARAGGVRAQAGVTVARSPPPATAMVAATKSSLLMALAAHLAFALLPRVLRLRGRIIRAKVMSAVKFRLLFQRVRRNRPQEVPSSEAAVGSGLPLVHDSAPNAVREDDSSDRPHASASSSAPLAGDETGDANVEPKAADADAANSRDAQTEVPPTPERRAEVDTETRNASVEESQQ